MKVLFSILRYQLITDEFMNIGVLFHNLDTDERRLELITKWKRLQNFDDEIDITFLKIILQGLKDEISNNLFNKNTHFNIYDYPLKYVNELRFTNIYECEIDDFETFFTNTKKNVLRYDYEKSLRPNKSEQIKYMKSIMKSNSIEFSSKEIKGQFLEKVQYDYIVGKYAFKVFIFEGKKIANLISSAKSWAYTASEMKDKYETIFLYDKDINNAHFDSIIKILKTSGCKVIKLDEGIDLALKVGNESKGKTYIL